jgi:5-methylcytosine-specific restriction protein B
MSPTILDLQGRPIFKISMGDLLRKASDLLPELRRRQWAVMHAQTGKGRGDAFVNGLQIGDYLYVCLKSDELWAIGRVISECKLLPLALMGFDLGEPWVYREYEIVAEPVNAHPGPLANQAVWSPSGNSALGMVTEEAQANAVLFEPYYGVRLTNANVTKQYAPPVTTTQLQRLPPRFYYIQPGPDGAWWPAFKAKSTARLPANAPLAACTAFGDLRPDDVLVATTYYDQAMGLGLVVEVPSVNSEELTCDVSWLLPESASMGNNTFLTGVPFGRTHQWARIRQAYAQQHPALHLVLDTYFPPASTSPATPLLTYPLNQILFGPPGTGKTYATAAWAVAILEGRPVEEVEAEYQDQRPALQQLLRRYHALGQVEFVTFHQSFSYEDFVEGIKPHLTDQEAISSTAGTTNHLAYRLEDGAFMRLSNRAVYGLNAYREQQQPSSASPDFDTLYQVFIGHLQQRQTEQAEPLVFKTKSGPEVRLQPITEAGKLYLRHVNGQTDTQYLVSRDRLQKLYQAFPSAQQITNVYDDITACIGGCNASVYWAMFNEFKKFETAGFSTHAQPISLEERLRRMQENYGAVRDLAHSFNYDKLTPSDLTLAPRFVLIIDEINRGNVASIFGELITLLEEDKRGGTDNALSLLLPYSKQAFTVPPNLYLLGTMNTADRSVEALDTALRRRFAFVEMPPRPEKLPKDVAGVNLDLLLTALNERLEYLSDRDHRLGHAWLMGVNSLPALQHVFEYKILPQLQEYFYGNWGRIRQVLGKRFVEKLAGTVSLLDAVSEEDFTDVRPRYRITTAQSWDVAAFQSIYGMAPITVVSTETPTPTT